MKNKVFSIQYLRGFAALLVVVTHVCLKMEQCGYEAFRDLAFNGAIGVDLFFIISGYVMCMTTTRVNRGELASTTGFLRRRILRIFPLYWALTGIALVLYLIAPGQVNQSGGETVIVESFLLLPTEGKYLVKNGWTLTFEMYFYGVFALSLLMGRRVGLGGIFAVISLPVIFPSLIPFGGALKTFLSHNLMLEFLFGIGLFQVMERLRVSGRIPSAWIGCALFFAAGGWLIWTGFEYQKPTRFLEFGIPSLVICFGALLMEPWFAIRRSRLFEMIGDSSYSLYLIHPFVLGACRSLFLKFGEASPVAAPFLFGAMVVLSVCAGYLSYVLFEDSANKYFKGRPRSEYLAWQYFRRLKNRIFGRGTSSASQVGVGVEKPGWQTSGDQAQR